jgi:8-oxo-dGTP pyrophosphatase MutT (NUDIX family)
MYIERFNNYIPKCEQEEVDKLLITEFIENNNNSLLRTNLTAHVTSSAIVVNEEMDKVLFVHHNIYNSWAWVGGHNDGNPDLLEVAVKEAKEETGLIKISPYNNDIIAIDVIHVNNHIKNGAFISDHLHLNATFLLIANEEDNLIIKEDENSGVKWFYIKEIMNYVSEERIKKVYRKIFDQITNLKNTA